MFVRGQIKMHQVSWTSKAVHFLSLCLGFSKRHNSLTAAYSIIKTFHKRNQASLWKYYSTLAYFMHAGDVIYLIITNSYWQERKGEGKAKSLCWKMISMSDVGRSLLSRENSITSTSSYAKHSPNWRKKYCKRDSNVEKVF